MKKLFAVLWIAFLLSTPLTHGAENDNLHVGYIANEGFLIRYGNMKILIDALFKDNRIDFCDVPSEETLRKILSVKPPYDDVDLLLFTHQHLDHFDTDLALTYMENNKQCILLGPQQVVDQLSKFKKYEKVKNRIRSTTPPYGSSEDISIDGIKLLVLRLQHSSYFVTEEKTGKKVNLHENIQNLGFVINLGNYNMLHIGDSSIENIEEYKSYRLDKEKIDIAFLGWFFELPRIEAVNNYIKPRDIIMMHLPKNKEPYFELRDIHQSSLAPITIFTKELEKKEFNK